MRTSHVAKRFSKSCAKFLWSKEKHFSAIKIGSNKYRHTRRILFLAIFRSRFVSLIRRHTRVYPAGNPLSVSSSSSESFAATYNFVRSHLKNRMCTLRGFATGHSQRGKSEFCRGIYHNGNSREFAVAENAAYYGNNSLAIRGNRIV